MAEKEPSQLHLNPGPKHRRNSISGCKCLFRSCLFLCAIIFGAFILAVARDVLNRIAQTVRFPHQALWQNQSLDAVTNRSSVVQPLINNEQTFDIAVSVWIRNTKAEEEERRKTFPTPEQLSRLSTNLGKKTEESEGDVVEPAFVTSPVNSEVQVSKELSKSEILGSIIDQEVLETPLYSDIAFRGLRLSDEGISADVKFRLPTARFREVNLTNNDLRGSFVLIPSSPSSLDFVKNYSSWIPASVYPQQHPYRAWPFPLGNVEHDKTLADLVLESFGVSTPLIQFHEIQSQCSNSTGDVLKSEDDDDDDNDDGLETENISVENPPPHKGHPHVVTRTHLIVVKETKLFNRKAYNKAHKQLKATSCGQGQDPSMKLNFSSCTRTYHTNGNWETRLEVAIPDETEGAVRTEWVYAPYMSAIVQGYGPKDLIPVPVIIDNCSAGIDITDNEVSDGTAPRDEEFLDISWHISYSGRTPAQLLLADKFIQALPLKHNATEHEKALAHSWAETWNGLFGHKFYEDGHPRRRLFIISALFVVNLLLKCLAISYWYTRTSTVSISISGNLSIALGDILLKLANSMQALWNNYRTFTPWAWFFTLIMFPFTEIPLRLMIIKAVTRSEFSWWRGTTWIPIVQRSDATHRERASERLDSRTSWSFKRTFFVSSVAIYYFLKPHTYAIIPSLLPPQDSATAGKLSELSVAVVRSLELTGLVTQLLLNHRSRMFAGQYKVSVALRFVACALSMSLYVPTVVGRFDARLELSAQALVDLGLLAVLVWQALVFPGVSQQSDDEHAE